MKKQILETNNRILPFRDLKVSVDQSCRGFFMDWRHLGNHFSYLTGCPPLDDNLKQNLRTQIGWDIYFIFISFRTSCYLVQIIWRNI